MPSARQARFVLSAPGWRHLPPTEAPEVAFAGRSNVGKSSLVGALMGAARLVRTSRTPGRTRLLNLFASAIGGADWAICDLPGYGWARVSQSERRRLAAMVRDYLRHRRTLVRVVLLIDGRHASVSPLDVAMLRALEDLGRSTWVVATKCDAVATSRRGQQLRTIARGLGIAAPPHATSARTGLGIKELARALGKAAELPAGEA